MPWDMLIAMAVPLVYGGLLLIESLRPAVRRKHSVGDEVRWQLAALGFFLLIGVINQAVSVVAPRLVPPRPLVPFGVLPLPVVFLTTFGLFTLGNALLHRAYHLHPGLWRHVHRYHHRPERMDVAGVMHQTPWEMTINAVLFTFVTVYVIETPSTMRMVVAWTVSFYGMFQHLNTATPRWLGWLIQRPESHSIHHQRRVHAYNYSDFPPWDWLMNTYRNPAGFVHDVGIRCDDGDDGSDREATSVYTAATVPTVSRRRSLRGDRRTPTRRRRR